MFSTPETSVHVRDKHIWGHFRDDSFPSITCSGPDDQTQNDWQT